jgi:hypothetical protein
MMRRLAFAVLVLLALGLASQSQAQTRIQCPVCEGSNTWAHFFHDDCVNGIPPWWPQWDEEAYSDNGKPPPYESPCPACSEMIEADYCRCNDCAATFWP